MCVRERDRDGDRESVRVCLCGECMWRMCRMYVKLWRGVSPLCPVCIRRCGVCRWYVPACTRNLDEILFSLTPKPETRNNKRRHLDTIPLGVVQGNSRLMAFFFWHREREKGGGPLGVMQGSSRLMAFVFLNILRYQNLTQVSN